MWASTEELKRHALAKPVPPPLSPAAQLRTVTFLVRIDRTGAVVEVVQALGDSAVVEALRNTVMNWRFSPFVSGGSPVEVRAVLPFHVSAGGVVTAGL
jgi:outer membrane biosynthesis protein TonB